MNGPVFSGAPLLEEVHLPSLENASLSMFGEGNSLKVIELVKTAPRNFPMLHDGISLILPDQESAKQYDKEDGQDDHKWHGMTVEYSNPTKSYTVIIAISVSGFVLVASLIAGFIIYRKYSNASERIEEMEQKEALALAVIADFG